MPRPLLCLLSAVALAAAGCSAEPPALANTASATPERSSPAAFDPTACGTLTGLVTWVGAIPDVPPVSCSVPRADGSGFDPRFLPQANTPRIEFATRGVGGAVVYLRGVDPARARPWDLPGVRVEVRDVQIGVVQGDRTGRTGFVFRGGEVTMQSVDPGRHVLRARDAAFFALPFPDPDRPLARAFGTCGRVELTSAAGYYWHAAELFVCDHPYYAVTENDGRFRFTQVPAGQYDLVVWHPNWVVTHCERNPETGLPSRQCYAPPLESARPVTVLPGRSALANLTLPK